MLDKDKPYGEVYGTGVQYNFTQNGKFYRLDGKEVTEDGKLVKKPGRPASESK